MPHELENSSEVSEKQANELRSIVEHLPSKHYLDDLRSVTDLLDQLGRKKGSESRRIARSVANQNGPIVKTDTSAKSRPVHNKESRRKRSR